MYFWKIEKLKEDIVANRLTEKDRFIYMLIYIMLTVILTEAMILSAVEGGNLWDLIYSIGSAFIVLFGTIFAFKANGASEGSDFLGKYFSIGFVIAIRFLVYAIPFFIMLIVYYVYAFGEEEYIPTSYIDVIPSLLFLVLVYWRLYVHIKQVNSPDRNVS